jgi:hypothetical protein
MSRFLFSTCLRLSLRFFLFLSSSIACGVSNLPPVLATLHFRSPPHSHRVPGVRALRLVHGPTPSIVSMRVPRSGDRVPVNVSFLPSGSPTTGRGFFRRFLCRTRLPLLEGYLDAAFVVASAIRVERVFLR